MNGPAHPVPPTGAWLLDERSDPSLRRRIGERLARAAEADFAIGRLRIDGLDLGRDELRRVARCRVLVGRIGADTFADAEIAAGRDRQTRDNVLALREFLASGRLEVRSAGTRIWDPDFSILTAAPARDGDETIDAVVFVGSHHFGRPHPPGGAALTCMLSTTAAVTRARERFDELWRRGYEIGPVVAEMLDGLALSNPEEPDRTRETAADVEDT